MCVYIASMQGILFILYYLPNDSYLFSFCNLQVKRVKCTYIVKCNQVNNSSCLLKQSNLISYYNTVIRVTYN